MKVSLNYFIETAGLIACKEGKKSLEEYIDKLHKKSAKIRAPECASLISKYFNFLINESENEYR